MADSFTHLHVHTEYSMLDGAARIKEVVGAAAADGQPALGITDHGNMYGILDFYKECRAQGIKPVLGSELYMAHESRHERPSRRGRMDDGGGDSEGGQKLYYHLTALAESNEGYRNLIALSSEAYLTGYHYKPKADFDLLAEHSKGLIVTSGCLGGHVLQALMRDDIEGARKAAGRLQDIFGRDSFFIEMQDHGIPEQHRTNPMLLELAEHLQAPLLATNDSHYVHRHDSVAHDALLCVQTGSQMSDPDRFKFHGDEHYLKPAHEMRHLFEEIPEACDNTLWIAERADVDIEFGKPQLPSFPLPEGFTSDADYLRHLTMDGARRRWGSGLHDAIVERLHYELGVIESMGFSSYFLIVWDLIKHARDNGIRVGPGRGSAAGCAVAYTLWITDLDPIEYDLLFERFLNPSRISMPDIDMDFDSRYRDEMIRYAAEKYGRDHVAQIVTFSTIKARAAVRDAARVLGYPYGLGDKVAKAMPPLIMGRDTPLWACLERDPKYEDGYKMAADLRRMREEDEDAAKVIEVAKGLEGLRRQDGIHAAAVVITKEPLTTYLPIQRKPEGGQDPEDAPIVTQYEMHGVEELGLLKMDFLGLRNLDVISDTVEIIRDTRGVDLDIDAIPLDDEKTYHLLSAGQGIGVFQLEGGPMRALMRSLAPTSFEDVAALVALYRPGPMAANMHNDYADRKNGRKPVDLLHPDAEEILAETYGLCLTGDAIVTDVRTGTPRRLDSLSLDEGFLIQGVDAENQPVVREVTHWVCNGKREVVELRLANGMCIKGTVDHPVLTERGWVPLGALDVRTDHVAVPKELLAPVTERAIDRSALRVLAYLIADGALTTKASVVFTNTDEAICAEFTECVGRAFPGSRVSASLRPNGVWGLSVYRAKDRHCRVGELLAWLRELGLKAEPGAGPGGLGSAEKFVPPEVFELGNESVAFFLASLWDCDGHVNSRLAHYRTISKSLASDVQRLLMRLGFAAVVYEAECVRPRDQRLMTAYQVTVYDGGRFAALIAPYLASRSKREAVFDAIPNGGTVSRALVIEAVGTTWSGSKRELARITGLSRGQLHPNAAPRMLGRSAAALADALDLDSIDVHMRLQWVGIRSVEAAGRALVYDISVDEIHNFVANGIVVHNCVYQEQVMRVAQKFAGYSLADADLLRKSMGKKSRDLMVIERDKFVSGCASQGYDELLGRTWFDIIEQFADYAFNKSHSYGYGFIAYQTAYLKANHPAEYLAALLTSVKANLDKAAIYLAECRTMGIEVLVPDVNRSVADFTPVVELDADTGTEKRSIVFGLSAVRNVGSGLVALLIAEREANGPFADFYDFAERVDFQVLNKKTIESLVKAGAFDILGHPRQGLLRSFEHIIDTTLARRRERDMGVMSLFGEIEDAGPLFDERPPIPAIEFAKRERLSFEKEMLGLYVSDHPLMGAEASLRRRCDGRLTDLPEIDDGTVRTFGGVVTSVQRKWTKKGDLMAVFALEDLQTSVEVMVFPKAMTDHGHKLVDDGIVTVRARVDGRDDQPKLIAMEIEPFEPMSGEAFPLRVKVAAAALSEGLIADLKRLLGAHPGDSPVLLHLGESKVLRLPEAWTVEVAPSLLAELRVLLGPSAIMA